jgi:N-acetylmuramoyl-L-alanine amidase
MSRSHVTATAAIAALAAVSVASALLGGPASASKPAAENPHRVAGVAAVATALAGKSLAGKTIVIDPGHQLGNATHPRQINRPVNAGGFMKPCNTTGAATNGGYPEATFNWKVATALARQLRARGARVIMTRHTNSYKRWGPCIDVRGRIGNKAHADAKVSIHGDGADASVRGFFVIRPADRRRWTHDIFGSSARLAKRVKAGLVRAGARPSNSYGGDGLDVRGDLGTLNWSDRPTVLVELGNMRNARDARHITSPKFRRHVYARGLRIGLTRFVLR